MNAETKENNMTDYIETPKLKQAINAALKAASTPGLKTPDEVQISVHKKNIDLLKIVMTNSLDRTVIERAKSTIQNLEQQISDIKDGSALSIDLIRKDIVEAVNGFMEQNDLNQKTMAEYLNVDKSKLSRLTAGRLNHIGLETMVDIFTKIGFNFRLTPKQQDNEPVLRAKYLARMAS